MLYVKISTAAMVTVLLAAVVWSSESDDLRKKAAAMQREAAQLARNGHQKEAEQLERKALELLEEAEQLNRQRSNHHRHEIREMQAVLEELRLQERELLKTGGQSERLADIRHEAEKISQKLDALTGGHQNRRHEEHDDKRHPERDSVEGSRERLEHMRIAVENLNRAGLHDVARHVSEIAEETERHLLRRQHQDESNSIHEIMRQVEEIRHEIAQMRREINEIKDRR